MTAHNKDMKIETRAVQAGRVAEDHTGSVTTPIYASSTFRVNYPGDEAGYVYSRSANPTRRALEQTLASLENGTHGMAFSSGLAAMNAVLNLLETGDHVVAVDDLYGGSRRQFDQVMGRFNIEFSYVDGRNPQAFVAAICDNTKLIWIETPTNPLMHLVDIEAIVKIARERGIITAVDNTFATPYIQRPLELGADIVHHSMSKYLSGHCDVIAGAVIVRDEKLGERIQFNQNAIGLSLGPFESWLVLRGIKTLALRMDRHAKNAVRVVDYLKSEAMVENIYYPGIDGAPLPNRMKSAGGMVAFDLKADFDTVHAFVMATDLFILAESLGGVESLINHPASMTHASIPKDVREANGIRDSLIRLSVGIENIEDLLADLQHAFAAVSSRVDKS